MQGARDLSEADGHEVETAGLKGIIKYFKRERHETDLQREIIIEA